MSANEAVNTYFLKLVDDAFYPSRANQVHIEVIRGAWHVGRVIRRYRSRKHRRGAWLPLG